MARSFAELPSFAALEAGLWSPVDTEVLAADYARSYARARVRPLKPDTIYRYPRGRLTDQIPVAAALVGI
ncbi:MAG: hypothetical protein KUG77_25100 [Nannocystaceae bacterium]|nr:hypothetical protein [Nannocystaceae bacterium]